MKSIINCFSLPAVYFQYDLEIINYILINRFMFKLIKSSSNGVRQHNHIINLCSVPLFSTKADVTSKQKGKGKKGQEGSKSDFEIITKFIETTLEGQKYLLICCV